MYIDSAESSGVPQSCVETEEEVQNVIPSKYPSKLSLSLPTSSVKLPSSGANFSYGVDDISQKENEPTFVAQRAPKPVSTPRYRLELPQFTPRKNTSARVTKDRAQDIFPLQLPSTRSTAPTYTPTANPSMPVHATSELNQKQPLSSSPPQSSGYQTSKTPIPPTKVNATSGISGTGTIKPSPLRVAYTQLSSVGHVQMDPVQVPKAPLMSQLSLSAIPPHTSGKENSGSQFKVPTTVVRQKNLPYSAGVKPIADIPERGWRHDEFTNNHTGYNPHEERAPLSAMPSSTGMEWNDATPVSSQSMASINAMAVNYQPTGPPPMISAGGDQPPTAALGEPRRDVFQLQSEVMQDQSIEANAASVVPAVSDREMQYEQQLGPISDQGVLYGQQSVSQDFPNNQTMVRYTISK